jgi:type I site-specific restriction endonuclease
MSPEVNQSPEQLARDQIDDRLRASGWHVQDKDALDFSAGPGIAVREKSEGPPPRRRAAGAAVPFGA